MQTSKLLALFLVLFGIPVGAFAHWQSVGTLRIPEYNYSFLAASPSGDLVATTFNGNPPNTPPRELPTLLIRNPMSGTPEVHQIMRMSFDAQRGYSGVACDSEGHFYVSSDTGETATSFVRKFNPDGTPASGFGNMGELRPGLRCLGLTIFGDYLLLAVNWGQVQVYNKNTGRIVGMTGRPSEPVYVRDLAIEPTTMRIFGVAEGAVVTWGNGAPWNPGFYRFQQISPKAGHLRSGEGLSIDAIRRSVLVTPIPGNVLLEIEGPNRVKRHVVASAEPDTHLADSVLSFDGSALFISDMIRRRVHVMRRDMNVVRQELDVISQQRRAAVAQQVAGGQARAAATGDVPTPTWHRSYSEIVQRARTEGRPMVVYFRSPHSEKAREFEQSTLLTNEFNRHAQEFYCVFEDVTRDQLLAFSMGVYRVPHIMVLDNQGNTRAEFTWDIDGQALFEAMRVTAGVAGQ